MKDNFWRVDGLREIIDEKVAKYAALKESAKMITAVVVEPNKTPYAKEIGADEGSLYCFLEGPSEGRTLYGTGAEIVFNKFGKVLGLPSCRALINSKGMAEDVIAGTFVVVGVSVEDGYISLSEEQISLFCELFSDPICHWRYSLGFSEED